MAHHHVNNGRADTGRRAGLPAAAPAVLLLLIALGASEAAAAPSPQCRQGCKARSAACLTSLRIQRTAMRKACTGDRAGSRTCRQQAVGPLRAARAACRQAKAACKRCCRTDGKPCQDLGLVPASARSASASIGEAGGTLTATGLDGTRYRFEVPAGALVSEQPITMTPLAAVTNLPLSGGLAAAVQFSPDGLVFLRPATLVMTLPDGVDRRGLVGFGFRRAGEGLHLAVTTAGGRELTFAVSHFSGVGAARGTLDDLAALVGLLSDSVGAQLSSEFAENLYTSQIAQLMAQDVRDPLAYRQVLREWFRVSLQVTLSTAIFESGANQALLEYLAWKAAITSVSRFLGVDFAAAMATDVEGVDRGMARVLEIVGFGGAQARCFLAPSITSDENALAQAQLSAAHDALRWFRILEALGLAPVAPTAPTLASILGRLCVTVAPFDARVVPEDVAPGRPAELRVRAGLTFRNANLTPRAVVFSQPLEVQPTATGVFEPITGGPTDAQGIFRASFRRFGDAPVTIAVRACIVRPEFPLLRAVCGADDLTAGSTTTTSSSTTTTTSTTVPGAVFLRLCVDDASNVPIVCDGPVDLAGYSAGDGETFKVRVEVSDGRGNPIPGMVHVAVDLPPPPPLKSCPLCGRFLGLDENGNMPAGERFIYSTPPGSGTATVTLETAIGGSPLHRTFVIGFNNLLRPPFINPGFIGQEPGTGAAIAGFSAQVGDRGGDFVTLTVEGAPPKAAIILNNNQDVVSTGSVVIAPGGPHQPLPGTYVTTVTATDARGMTSTLSLQFTASDAGDDVVLLDPPPTD